MFLVTVTSLVGFELMPWAVMQQHECSGGSRVYGINTHNVVCWVKGNANIYRDLHDQDVLKI